MIDKKMYHIFAEDSNECNCPHCNSENIYYNDSYFDDWGSYVYEFVCEDCGAKGKQWYNLVFDGYTYSEPDND